MCLGISREMLAVAGIFKLVESLSQVAALRVLWLALAYAPVVEVVHVGALLRRRRCPLPRSGRAWCSEKAGM